MSSIVTYLASTAVGLGLSSVFWTGAYYVAEQNHFIQNIPFMDNIVNQALAALGQ